MYYRSLLTWSSYSSIRSFRHATMYSVQPSFSRCLVIRFCLSSNVAGTASSVYETRTSMRSTRLELHADYFNDQSLTAHNDVSPFDSCLASSLLDCTGTGHLHLASGTSKYLCGRRGCVFIVHMSRLTFPSDWAGGRQGSSMAGRRCWSRRRTWVGRVYVPIIRLDDRSEQCSGRRRARDRSDVARHIGRQSGRTVVLGKGV